MVCSLGSGRMAVMARLLASRSSSQNIQEVGQQKLAAKCFNIQLNEADEANLLDEEDMNVYGLKPMTDPLDLVCCNACKKPVKASHFVTHAELCRFLHSAEETLLEPDGDIGHRKPPRKGRKKLSTTYINQATPIMEPERPVSIGADYVATSECKLDAVPGTTSSFSMDAKRNSICVDVASRKDVKGVSSENTDHSACVMPPPTKRPKLVSSQHLSPSNDLEAASGLTKVISTKDVINCKTDVPVPFATKIYYSQKNNRLRSAIAQMYHAASEKELGRSAMSAELSEEATLHFQALHHQGCSPEPADDLFKKKREASACNPEQIVSKSSKVCSDNSGECISASGLSNQFPVDSTLRPQTAPVSMLRNKYVTKPYSFAGQSVGTIQQPSGSVHVL